MFENWILGGPRQRRNDGGVVVVQGVAVWQRADQLEGVRWSHEEKSDLHLPHHFRKLCRRVDHACHGACEQEAFWMCCRWWIRWRKMPCNDVRSEHTPIKCPSRTSKNDLTVALSEDSDHLPQQSAPSSSCHSVASIVPAFLNFGSLRITGELVRQHDAVASSFSGTGKPVQGNEFGASVEESASRRKRDRDLNSVQTCSDRQHLHDYLERKAESAFRGECAFQRR